MNMEFCPQFSLFAIFLDSHILIIIYSMLYLCKPLCLPTIQYIGMTLQSFQMLWEGNYVSNGGRREKTQVAFIIGPKKQKSYFYQVFNIFKIYFLITDIALEFSYTFTMPTPLHSCCWELDKQITQIM